MDAAESKLSLSDTTTKTIDGGLRALVRGNRSVSANVAVPSEDNLAAAASISVSTNVTVPSEDSLAAGAASIADIERLMAELLVARDYLQAEGERVRRVNANYAHLAQTASASVKIIAESIGKWRTTQQDSVNQTPSANGGIYAPALSQARDGNSDRSEVS
jgi:hypothetical protein